MKIRNPTIETGWVQNKSLTPTMVAAESESRDLGPEIVELTVITLLDFVSNENGTRKFPFSFKHRVMALGRMRSLNGNAWAIPLAIRP
jgi:hypothetical protein